MSISYKIKVNGSSENALTVDIGTIPGLALPVHITQSILPSIKKIARVAEYMNSVFVGNDPKHAEFRHAVASIVKAAKEKGTLNIVCKHKLAELHTKSIVKYLTDNADMIDALSPYILGTGFQKPVTKPSLNAEENEQPEAAGVLVDSGIPEVGSIEFKGEGMDRLSQDDMSQIAKLMGTQMLEKSTEPTPLAFDDDVTDVVAKEVVEPATVVEEVISTEEVVEEVKVEEEEVVTETEPVQDTPVDEDKEDRQDV